MGFYLVSGLGRVILILMILIIDELCEFINKTLKAPQCDIVTKTFVFIQDARPVFSMNMCGTARSCLKPSATRWGIF